MLEIFVDRFEIAVTLEEAKELLAHSDQHRGATRGEIEAAKKLLPPRLGGLVQRGRRARPGLLAELVDGALEPSLIGPELLREHQQEGFASCRAQCIPLLENLARQRNARRLAACRQEHIAHAADVGRRPFR